MPIKRFWEVSCDYCGRVLGRQDKYAPKPENCTQVAFVKGKHIFCNENCCANYEHDKNYVRLGNLKQFKPGKTFTRK